MQPLSSLPIILIILFSISTLICASPSLSIRLPANLPPLPPSTHAILTAPPRPLITTPITTRNGFNFRNLTAGVYDLDVACREYDFEKGLVVEVTETSQIEVKRGSNVVASSGAGNYEVEGKAWQVTNVEFEMGVTRRREWREERGGCEFLPCCAILASWRMVEREWVGVCKRARS